ncbi:MAG TPA: phosphatase PAP2 family protein [Kineosporiaceae bacterium]|nr:phosphatase PAP2 family protein [Kineosporiaceae bacterium]
MPARPSTRRISTAQRTRNRAVGHLPHATVAGAGGGRGGLSIELRHDVPRLVAGGVAVYAFLAVTGLLVTRVFDNGPLIQADQRISRWFFERRTPSLNTWTHIGTSLSDTVSAIALTMVLVIGLRLWLKRWREAATIFVSITGELFIFVLVTATVHRQRPTVPHLDPAPPTSSFPSGHTGAAVALYVGLAVILLLVTRGSVYRVGFVVAAAVLCIVPFIVGLSRMYRGMHFFTDVIAGALAGGLWMAIVVATLIRSGGAMSSAAGRAGSRR